MKKINLKFWIPIIFISLVVLIILLLITSIRYNVLQNKYIDSLNQTKDLNQSFNDLGQLYDSKTLEIKNLEYSKLRLERDYNNLLFKQQIESNPKYQMYTYMYNKQPKSMTILVYGGLNDYLKGISRDNYSTYQELDNNLMSDPIQREYLLEIVDEIRNITDDKEEQAKIAISFVQRVRYDTKSVNDDNLQNRYPYEVLYSKRGVCSETSRLLAFVLSNLGFGTALMGFDPEPGEEYGHEVVGISCPTKFAYLDTNYCYIETTTPSIITDSGGDRRIPYINVISDGLSLTNLSEEYKDAKYLESLYITNSEEGGLDCSELDDARELKEKYKLYISVEQCD